MIWRRQTPRRTLRTGLALSVVVVLAALNVPSSPSQNSLQVGYATLTPDGGIVAPVGSAVFSYTNPGGVLVSQAGVGAVTPMKRGRIFVDQAGTATALAMVNPSNAAATATLTLRDLAGRTIGTKH